MTAIADRLTRALHAHTRGEHQFAAEGFQAVLAEDPGNVNALHLLGLTYLNSGRPAEADELIWVQSVSRQAFLSFYKGDLRSASVAAERLAGINAQLGL